MSLLEVESDLKQKLARMEAERSQERDSPAVQGQAEAETPPAADEPAGVDKTEAVRDDTAD